jgi:hypothetical protein
VESTGAVDKDTKEEGEEEGEAEAGVMLPLESNTASAITQCNMLTTPVCADKQLQKYKRQVSSLTRATTIDSSRSHDQPSTTVYYRITSD